jgi:16S rRNA C967 or C1407 C5-methylase (RsmB/RsmF family)
MRTYEDYMNMFAVGMDFELSREYFRNLKKANNRLKELVYETGRPDWTVSKFVDEFGLDKAIEIVATHVNRNAWDGRISKKNSEWAKMQENAWDEKAAVEGICFYTEIHMAHLDQIASELRKYIVMH